MSDEQQPQGQHEVTEQTRKKNRALGLALFAFVIIVAVVSYFKIKSLAP
ncbi:hypothetical protein GCM10017044_26910 [Kordiimonas sediminis]|uniref:Uncharacterized protein n=1 Tax=Kordiimonas sediminis TaxID=1735581 RepID=A0A919E924_9PROT|nr:hypothetical protein [Kordiimonas sediminis]GHF30158.1 hypothetical protein GCM10017044_26910 [Kordiimonas sediminis]